MAVVHNLMAAQVYPVYNGSGSTLSKGAALRFSGTNYNVADPVPGTGVTSSIPGVTTCNAYEENFLGVAMEDIPTSSWGLACFQGKCQVRMAASQTGSVGNTGLSDASGNIVVSAAAGAIKHCIFLEDPDSSATAGDLKWAYVDTRGGALGVCAA